MDHAGPAWEAVSPHLRHCVEHFQLLLAGIAERRVDYDARRRSGSLERSPEAVREALTAIAREIHGLRDVDLCQPLLVLQSAASGRPKISSPSSLERELVFVAGHAIHHIAIMALAAAAAGVVFPPELAVAHSTEAHRESIAR